MDAAEDAIVRLGEAPGRSGWKSVVVLLAASLAVTGVAALVHRPIPPGTHPIVCCDDLYYRSMATSLFDPSPDVPVGGLRYSEAEPDYLDAANGFNHQPPFVYRPAVPLLARALAVPVGDLDRAFYLLAFVSLAGAAFFLALAIARGFGRLGPALLSIPALFGCYWSTRLYLTVFAMTEPVALLLTCVALYALVVRNRALFFGAAALGALAREAALGLLFVYPLSEWFMERRVRATTVGAFCAVAGTWAGVRLGLGRLVAVDRYSPFALLQPTPSRLGVVVAAALATIGVLLVPSWRALVAPLTRSLVPLLVLPILGAFQEFGGARRYLAQLIPVFLMAAFSFLPPGRVARGLLVVPVLLSLAMPLLVTPDGTVNYAGLAAAMLFAAASELMLIAEVRSSLRWSRDPKGDVVPIPSRDPSPPEPRE